MKKLLPLALTAMAATACTYDNNGNAHWAGMRFSDQCAYERHIPLSERNLAASRGAHHEEFEHNDVIRDGYYYDAPWPYGQPADNRDQHWKHHHWRDAQGNWHND